MRGWIGFHRSEETDELLAKEPKAFVLLAVIARRARWKNPVIPDGLTKGDALIGKNDFEKFGWTEHDYRRAKQILGGAKLVSFRRAKGTTKSGTVATLLDARVFSLTGDERNEPVDESSTTPPRSDNDSSTTPQRQSKKGKKEEEGFNNGNTSPAGKMEEVI